MSVKKAAAPKMATTKKSTSPKAEPSKAKKSAETVVEKVSTTSAGKQKASMHPRFREITVIMTNGTSFKTRSTCSSDVLKLEIDVTTHPAWTNESNFVNLKADKVTAFNTKYQGLSFLKSN
jgi:large subunit ribosomal protein L31